MKESSPKYLSPWDSKRISTLKIPVQMSRWIKVTAYSFLIKKSCGIIVKKNIISTCHSERVHYKLCHQKDQDIAEAFGKHFLWLINSWLSSRNSKRKLVHLCAQEIINEWVLQESRKKSWDSQRNLNTWSLDYLIQQLLTTLTFLGDLGNMVCIKHVRWIILFI